MTYTVDRENLQRLINALRSIDNRTKGRPERIFIASDPDVKNALVALSVLEMETGKQDSTTLVPTGGPLSKPVERVVWTDKSTRHQCFWSGARARCIFEFGHPGPHDEGNAAPTHE